MSSLCNLLGWPARVEVRIWLSQLKLCWLIVRITTDRLTETPVEHLTWGNDCTLQILIKHCETLTARGLIGVVCISPVTQMIEQWAAITFNLMRIDWNPRESRRWVHQKEVARQSSRCEIILLSAGTKFSFPRLLKAGAVHLQGKLCFSLIKMSLQVKGGALI